MGRLLPDQSARRKVPRRPRSADSVVLVTTSAATAAAAVAATAATTTVQRAGTAPVRRTHGGRRVRPGQRGCR